MDAAQTTLHFLRHSYHRLERQVSGGLQEQFVIRRCLEETARLKHHVEENFNHFRRDMSHTSPDHEEDVARLQAKYHEEKVHVQSNPS